MAIRNGSCSKCGDQVSTGEAHGPDVCPWYETAEAHVSQMMADAVADVEEKARAVRHCYPMHGTGRIRFIARAGR